MAKVTGPLMSMSASGKLGQAIVFFPWKGLSVVREWLKPANPKTGAQGDARLILGGLGRAVSPISKLSLYAEYAREVAPTGQTWVSKIVQYIRNTWMPTAAKYQDELAEVIAHGAGADFSVRAGEVGLVTFDIAYKATADVFANTLQLYEMAKFARQQYLLDNTKFKTAPYTKDLATWDDADIVLMVADFAAI